MSPALTAFAAVAWRSWHLALRRPVHLSFSLLQPLIWLLFFGALMRRFPLERFPGGVDYLSFLLPGVCAMTVLFGASQAGVALIRDMQTGFLQRTLATPAPRLAVHLGKVAADALRLLAQAGALLLIGLAAGVHLQFAAGAWLSAALALASFALAFGGLSCWLALRARKPETLATFIHVVNMPLFFTSTALAPRNVMPDWLAGIAALNPLTPVVDVLRGALLHGQAAEPAQLLGLLILAVAGTALATRELGRAAGISAWETR